MKITSKENLKIKFLKKLRDDSKFRYENSLFLVEGEKQIKDTDINLINEVFIDESYKGFVPPISKDKIYELTNNVFNSIKDTVSSQGIVATIKINNISLDNICLYDKILLLDNVNDPGNIGTIIRTSEAMGINAIIFANNCCDPYNQKSIRSSMSSITRINIYVSNDYINDIKLLKNNNYILYGTFLKNSEVLSNINFNKKMILVLGNEANGISKDIENLCDYRVLIPMKGKIESLNVSIANAMILYELNRKS